MRNPYPDTCKSEVLSSDLLNFINEKVRHFIKINCMNVLTIFILISVFFMWENVHRMETGNHLYIKIVMTISILSFVHDPPTASSNMPSRLSEPRENLEEMFPLYFMLCDVCIKFKSWTTLYFVICVPPTGSRPQTSHLVSDFSQC